MAGGCGSLLTVDQDGRDRPVDGDQDGVAACDAGSVEAHQPNIVVIMTDDQWLDSMSELPNVRSLLGSSGTTFTNAIVTFPTCCPSRATYLSGQYTHNHGVEWNFPDSFIDANGGFVAFNSANALPVWMENAGYTTVHIGKFLNGYGTGLGGSHPTDVPPGWTEWYVPPGGETYNYYDFRLNENGELVCYGSPPGGVQCDRMGRSLYQTDEYTIRAVNFIRAHAADKMPFFLSLAPIAPHVGYNRIVPVPARRHAGRYAGVTPPESAAFNETDVSDKASPVRGTPPLGTRTQGILRDNWRIGIESLLAVDVMVRAVHNELAAQGILENTIIYFTSDNGNSLGEHRILFKGRPYERQYRVPLVISGGDWPAGVTSDFLAGNIDLAPTIAAAANAIPLVEVDGIDLLPAILNPSQARRRAFLIASGRTLGIWNMKGWWYAAIHTGEYLLTEWTTATVGTEYELWDLMADPLQLNNVARDPAYANIEAHLLAELAALRVCSGSSCQ
jgi:arylsulfatase A-like enzyme